MSYTIQISNEKYENLVFADQLVTLTLTEVIGNLLPMFTMTFIDNDYQKLEYMNEKSPITIGYQLDGNMVSNQFIIKPKNPIFNNTAYTCAIGGYLNKFEYFKGLPKVPYIEGTSCEALEQLASAYFKFQSSGLQTDDKMVWLHNGKNARNFIQDIWKHMYSPSSLPLISIGLDGIFRLEDLAHLIQQKPKYKFADSMSEGYELYASAQASDNSSGTTSIFGYTSERNIILEDNLEVVTSTVKPEVVMNTSIQLNEADMPTRPLAPMFQSTNVHKHWYEAFHQNIVRWSSLNSNTVQLTLQDNLLPLNLMDMIYIKFAQDGGVGRNSDGNFIIGKKELIFDGGGRLTSIYTGIREVSQNINKAEANKKSNISVYKI